MLNRDSNTPVSASAFTAPVMLRRPENRIPKPMAILPTDLEFLKLHPMIMIIPIISAIGASEEGLKSCRIEPDDASRSSRRMIWPVTVVPTLAPMIMPSDCRSVSTPAPTRPDVITMVAVED